MSYLRSHAQVLAIESSWFGKTDVHIHVPGGAVPKDGPSAGVAITSALLSLVRRMPIRPNLAMTGEVTLTGRVLPVGGIREKVLAARRAGMKEVLIPRHNEKDLRDLPAEVKADMIFHSVDTLDDVVPHLFAQAEPKRGKHKAAPSRGRRHAPARAVPPPPPHAGQPAASDESQRAGKSAAPSKPTRRSRSV